ncbi:MAG: galactokinase [Gemmatimonadota bacterium]|nr:galactokinase [Gemmatimonadota bacterium]
MSTGESEVKAARFTQLAQTLAGMEDSADDAPRASGALLSFWVPGRIEVLGKHTDYGGGRSLLCAVERGICVVAQPRQVTAAVPRVRVLDANSGEMVELDLSPDVAAAPGHWSNYPITVARRIASNFSGDLRGADIAFASDLPPAAGVSSSSALVVAVFLALSAANELPSSPEYRRDIHNCEDLAGYLGGVENGLNFKGLHGHAGVGTFGGSEDQTAILCARPNALTQYSFCPVTFERAVPLPQGLDFAIGASGVLAEKTGAALQSYNRVSRRLTAGLEAWRNVTGRSDTSMGAAMCSSADAPTRITRVLAQATTSEYPAESLVRRFEQFQMETQQLIPSAGDALLRGDLTAFGEIVARSQRAAETALENQIPQTIELVRMAREFGAVAASAFGAGFGGSVWALVRSEQIGEFTSRWSDAYRTAFPESAPRAEFFATRAGPAAMRV